VPRTWPSLVRLSDRLPLAYHIAYSPCAPRPSPTPWPTDPESSAGALHQNSLAKLTVQGSEKERTATAREEKRRASEEQETPKPKTHTASSRCGFQPCAFSLVERHAPSPTASPTDPMPAGPRTAGRPATSPEKQQALPQASWRDRRRAARNRPRAAPCDCSCRAGTHLLLASREGMLVSTVPSAAHTRAPRVARCSRKTGATEKQEQQGEPEAGSSMPSCRGARLLPPLRFSHTLYPHACRHAASSPSSKRLHCLICLH